MKLKVYVWTGWRGDCPPALNGSLQTREIMAAPSLRAVAISCGVRSSSDVLQLSETGNQDEIRVAMESPGVVFWRPLEKFDKNGLRYGWRRG